MHNKELHILLLEDNPDHADLFLANLELTAYSRAEVTQHQTLEQGKASLRAESFDLLFIDLSLQDSTISETLDQLPTLPAACPVIVLTSLDDEQTILNVIKQGADDCLPKSELTDTLLERLIHFNVDRWQLKQELIESKEAYRDLYHNSPNMHCSVDAATRKILTCNHTLAQKLGYDREEIIGKEIFSLYHQDSLRHAQESFASFVQTGSVTNAELQLRRRDGTKIDVLLNVSSVRDENGKILCSRSTWIDITEKKTAEKQLHYMQRLNRLIIETIPDLLWLKDIEGVYLTCNPRVEQFFGRLEPDIVGKTDYSLIEKEQAERFHQRDQQAINAGTAVVHEEWGTFTGDNSKMLLETIRTPLLYDNGIVAGVLGVGRDITERYEATEKAAAASRAKSAFLSNISHELRTPLNAILGYTQILLRDNSLTEKQHNEIQTIHRSGEHLLLLINDILDISKIESGRLEVVETEIHPLSFLHNIKDLIELRSKDKGIHFHYTVEGDVPDTILVDGLRLRQVLLNLLSNAVKFTETGYCTLTVRGKATKNNKVLLTFSVEDSGPGIAPEDQKIIFKPFRQVGDRLHHGEGTGLGLSISTQLVHLMGGTLELISPVEKEKAGKEGPGSCFFFTLEVPALHNQHFNNPKNQQQIITGYTSIDNPDKKQQVLIIDKIPSHRAILREILQSAGFIVHEVKDDKKLAENCRIVQPDILLLVLSTPLADSLLMGDRIIHHNDLADIPIIALSSLTTERNALYQQCLEHGFCDYIGRPYSANKLLETMASHLPITLLYSGTKKQAVLEDCILPPKNVLDELVDLVEIGDINGIKEKRKNILKKNPKKYSAFCQHVKKYSDEFQFTGLLNFIEANRSRI
jgi:PAS domain S-box-containing protein